MGSILIAAVAVIVPARDEESLLPRCLRSVGRAADALPDDLEVVVVVAADRCTDATVAVADTYARRDPRVRVVAGAWGLTGAARRAATDAALHELDHHPRSAVWIASTDADSVVPDTWLRDQLAAAEAGRRAVAGVVSIVADDPVLHARLRAAYPVVLGHEHGYVHGANLGVRADAYTQVGGWPTSTPTGEDQLLWDALVAARLPTLATSDLEVATSARTSGRAPDGFAARLSELAADLSEELSA